MIVALPHSEPVTYDHQYERWQITSYSLGLEALQSPLLTTRSPDAEESEHNPKDPMSLVFRQAMLHDGLPHQRIRTILEAAITRKVGLIKPHVQRLIPLLFHQPRFGPYEMTQTFAAPLPLLSLAHLLGLCSLDEWLDVASSHTGLQPLLTQLAPWERHLQAFGNLLTGYPTFEAIKGARWLQYDVANLLRYKRERPADDLATLCATANVFTSDDERISNLIMMFGAGSGTSTTLLLNGPVSLLQHPTAFSRLRSSLLENPTMATSLLRNVIEELLRLVTPTQTIARWAADDLTLGGHIISRGEKVVLDLAAMNRDPTVFTDPDQLILTRRNARAHVAFGMGPHGCPGKPLALLEMLHVLKHLITLPGLELIPGQTFTFGFNAVQHRLEQAWFDWNH
jgi:cytochrome P450